MTVKDDSSSGQKKNNSGGDGGDGGGGEKLDLDPLLIELLKKIPATDAGWPAPQRIRWFRTFAMNVSQIYDDDNSPVEIEYALVTGEQETNNPAALSRRTSPKCGKFPE